MTSTTEEVNPDVSIQTTDETDATLQKVNLAYKFRIYPTEKQKHFLNGQFGAARLCYNKAIWIWDHAYKFWGKSLSFKKDIRSLLPFAKKSRKYHWLKEYDSSCLGQAVLNAEAAAKDFMQGKKGFPKYKSRKGEQSSYHDYVKCEEGRISVPKIGWIKAVTHREVEGTIRHIVLKRDCCGDYYASVLYQAEKEVPKVEKEVCESKVVGIDLGISVFATLSDGKEIKNPRLFQEALDALKWAQKCYSRKEKGSNNQEKARLHVAKLHRRVARMRKALHHQWSHEIVEKYDVIVVETLDIKEMCKNPYLAQSILDAAWYDFLRMLEYKCERAGKRFIKIPKDTPTTQRCAQCGHVNEKKLSLKKRTWVCPNCNAELHRDLNAAINIKNEGLHILMADPTVYVKKGV